MKHLKSILTYTISLTLAGTLLYFAFKNIDLNSFIARIDSINYNWILLSVGLSLISHWIRAYRWNMLLEPLGFSLNPNRTFLAVMTGYLANIAFPRLGEVTRCGILHRTDKVPVSVSFGTVITERLIDFMILLSLILLDFLIEFDLLYDFFSQTLGFGRLSEYWEVITVVVVIIAISGFVVLLKIRNLIQSEIQNPWLNRIRVFIRDLLDGLLSLRKIKNLYGFLVTTMAIWVLYYLMSYILIFALPETSNLSLVAGLSILAAGGIAMSAPVQAGVGTYHAFVSGILLLYGIQQESGLFFATMLHASQIISIVLFGGISAIIAVFIGQKTSPDTQNS